MQRHCPPASYRPNSLLCHTRHTSPKPHPPYASTSPPAPLPSTRTHLGHNHSRRALGCFRRHPAQRSVAANSRRCNCASTHAGRALQSHGRKARRQRGARVSNKHAEPQPMARASQLPPPAHQRPCHQPIYIRLWVGRTHVPPALAAACALPPWPLPWPLAQWPAEPPQQPPAVVAARRRAFQGPGNVHGKHACAPLLPLPPVAPQARARMRHDQYKTCSITYSMMHMQSPPRPCRQLTPTSDTLTTGRLCVAAGGTALSAALPQAAAVATSALHASVQATPCRHKTAQHVGATSEQQAPSQDTAQGPLSKHGHGTPPPQPQPAPHRPSHPPQPSAVPAVPPN